MRLFKFLKFSILPLMLLAITGCGGDTSTSEQNSAPEEPGIVEIPFDDEDMICSGSVGYDLSDANINRYFAEDTIYTGSFSYGHSSSYRYTSSREESLTIETSGSSLNTFSMVTHKPGDSILSIYDDEDMLVYRNIIRVRKAYEPEEIPQALYDFDVFKGYRMFGNHRLDFSNVDPFEGVLSGTDDVEISPMNIVFQATYAGLNEMFDMYEFDLDVVTANEGSQTKVTTLLVSRTADFVILYYRISAVEEAMLNTFFPASLSNIHKDFF